LLPGRFTIHRPFAQPTDAFRQFDVLGPVVLALFGDLPLDPPQVLLSGHQHFPCLDPFLPPRRLLEEARPSIQAALDANPRNPYYLSVFYHHRWLLARTLLELGDHAAAAAEAAAELARVAFDPANDAYNAACFFAGCVALAEKDTKLTEGRRKELAKSYGDRALDALRQALAKGYKDAAHIKKDTDLDPLRGRDDFQKLLAEPEKGAGKEKPKGDRPQR
jgi:hypothetical protein